MGTLSGVSRAVEERIEKSAAGSPTVYCGTSGSGKLKLERASYIVGVRSKANQLSAKEAMGEGERSSVETQANDLGSRTEEDRGGTAGTLGKVESGEEGGVKHSTRMEPATSVAGFLFAKESLRLECQMS